MNKQEYTASLLLFCKNKRKQGRYRFLTMLLCIICSFSLVICLESDASGRLSLLHERLLFSMFLLSFSAVIFLSWFDLKIIQQPLQEAFRFGIQFEKEHNPIQKPLHLVQDLLHKNPRAKRYCVWLYTLAVGFLGFLLGLFSTIWVAEISKVLAVILISITSIGIYTICKQISRVEAV